MKGRQAGSIRKADRSCSCSAAPLHISAFEAASRFGSVAQDAFSLTRHRRKMAYIGRRVPHTHMCLLRETRGRTHT